MLDEFSCKLGADGFSYSRAQEPVLKLDLISLKDVYEHQIR